MGPSDMDTVFSLKKALRKATTATLKQLDQAHVQQQSQAVRQLLREKDVLKNARGVSCYLSMENGELSTSGIVQDILSANIPLYVPVIPSPRPKAAGADQYAPPPPEQDMRMLRLYCIEDFERCPRDKWGIPDAGRSRLDRQEEASDNRRQDAEDNGAMPLDVILVPGVAFDRGCGRVGHGKGYYDRYIQRYREHAASRGENPPLLVALALKEQIATEGVPRTENDELVDMVICPDKVINRAVT